MWLVQTEMYYRYDQRRKWHPIPVLLPGKSHGWRSLVGCSPWDREESDTTEQLHFHFLLLCIGEGNGNPLQCSCLENSRDGVAQSRTQLKWLSSSSIRYDMHAGFPRLNTTTHTHTLTHIHTHTSNIYMGFPGGSAVKNLPAVIDT